MKVVLDKHADRQLLKLPRNIHSVIIEKILQLTHPSPGLNIKKLAGRQEYRLRVGDYRVIYFIDLKNKEIRILAIAHRREVYR